MTTACQERFRIIGSGVARKVCSRRLALILMVSGLAYSGCGDEGPGPLEDAPPTATRIDTVGAAAFDVTLGWTRSSEPDFSHYVVQRSAIGIPMFDGRPRPVQFLSTEGGTAWIDLKTLAVPQDTLWTDRLVSPTHQYDYRIVTFDEAGQSASSDSVQIRTLSAPFAVLGLEPRFSMSDPFVGELHLWVDGLSDSNVAVSNILVEFALPKFAVFSSCDLTERPLPNWISLCQVDSGGASLGWSRLPKGAALTGGSVLATVEAQIPLGVEFTPHLVEISGPAGEPMTDTLLLRGILPPNLPRSR